MLVLLLRTYCCFSSTIWNQTVFSCESISSLYVVKFSNLGEEIYLSFVLNASSDRIFLSYVSRTWYPLIIAPAMNFNDHIRHFSFSSVNRIYRIVFIHSCTFLYLLSDFSQSSGLFIVLWSMLEGSNKLTDFTALYKLKMIKRRYCVTIYVIVFTSPFLGHFLLYCFPSDHWFLR